MLSSSAMATHADVRRIARSLPDVVESDSDFAFSAPTRDKLKAFAWVWKERVDPKKARVPNHSVLAVRVANVGQRDAMIAAEPKKFFTEPHYAGFPAVLVRIAEVRAPEMRALLVEGRRCVVSRDSASKTPARAAAKRAPRPRKRP